MSENGCWGREGSGLGRRLDVFFLNGWDEDDERFGLEMGSSRYGNSCFGKKSKFEFELEGGGFEILKSLQKIHGPWCKLKYHTANILIREGITFYCLKVLMA